MRKSRISVVRPSDDLTSRAKGHLRPRERSPQIRLTRQDSSPGVRELNLGFHFGKETFNRHVSLLSALNLSHSANAGKRVQLFRQLQQDYGNAYVRRLVDGVAKKRAKTLQAKLTVSEPGDKFEKEADRVASQVMDTVQRQEEEEVQMKALQRQDEEEELQMKPLQRQDEEEEVQMKAIQRQDEEEELQMKPLQRQDEEEEVQMKAIQRQDEEEEVQMKAIQR